MKVRYYAMAGSILSLAAIGSWAVSTLQRNVLASRAVAGTAHLVAVGTRSAAQRQNATDAKLDSALADLSRHASLARPDHMLADLHSLSPAARFSKSAATGAALVLIDANTRGDAQQLKSALSGLGLERAAVYSNDVGGWLPVSRIEAAAALGELSSIRAAMPRKASTGPVATQGDYAQRSDVVRTTYPSLTGAGITVGVLSDSFNCYAVYAEPGSGVPVSGFEGYAYNGFTADYATDENTSALPSGVDVLEEADCLDYGAPTQPPFGDEGRAMLQIVHAVAPDASLAFYTAEVSEADFANGITKLAAAGAKVIADDVGYLDEPYFQDGLVAESINTVEAQGVAYFTAAGNNGELSYYNTAPSFSTLSSSGENANEYLLNFDASGQTTTNYLQVTIPSMMPGDLVAIVLEWDQPYLTGAPSSGGATSQLDLCVTGASGVTIQDYDGDTVSCTGPNKLGQDPYQVLVISNPANASDYSSRQSIYIVVGLANHTAAPGRIVVSVEDDGLGSSIDEFATNSFTIQGHSNAATAGTVGAAWYFYTPRCGTAPAMLESYSSQGGAPTLFSTAGARLATPVTRQKPDFVGPDGVNDTFLGFTLESEGDTGGLLNTTITECQNNPDYPNFFGTSAATPHAAAIAALMLQANSTATPTQIYQALRTSALAMSSSTPSYNSGYGFIQADAALALIPAGAPTLTLASSSIAVGSSTTLTWSSVNTTGCTASGDWSGAQATSGTLTITPTATGTDTYSLACANAAGDSGTATATLTVTAKASSSHGGGALGGWSILGLAVLRAASWSRARAKTA